MMDNLEVFSKSMCKTLFFLSSLGIAHASDQYGRGSNPWWWISSHHFVQCDPVPSTLHPVSGLRVGTWFTLVEIGFIWSQSLQVAKCETWWTPTAISLSVASGPEEDHLQQEKCSAATQRREGRHWVSGHAPPPSLSFPMASPTIAMRSPTLVAPSFTFWWEFFF